MTLPRLLLAAAALAAWVCRPIHLGFDLDLSELGTEADAWLDELVERDA